MAAILAKKAQAYGKLATHLKNFFSFPFSLYTFYHTDHLGSIRAITNQDGKVVYKSDYLAFDARYDEETDDDFDEAHEFTGKEYDSDTGLYYYNARWYDSELGRFISEDPAADPNNPNLYSYCGNNPINSIDPTGCDDNDSYTLDEVEVTASKNDDGYWGDSGDSGSSDDDYDSSGNSEKTNSYKPVNYENFVNNDYVVNGVLHLTLPEVKVTATRKDKHRDDGESGDGDDGSSGNTIDAPGFWESLIPVWGSGKQAIYDFKTGNWGGGIVNSALAISDVF